MKQFLTKAFLTCALAAFIPLAHAGEKAGNGGVVFLCPDRVKLVDYWESEDLRNPMDIGHQDAPLDKLVDAYLERMEFFDEGRASVAAPVARTILADLEALARNPDAATELVRFTEGPLNFSLDSDEVSAPANCPKAQAVTQKLPQIEGEKLFTIYRPIWERMDNEMRVFTIFHEIHVQALIKLHEEWVYRYEKKLTKEKPEALTSTRPARLLNQYLGSERFARTKTICEYRRAVDRFGMLDRNLNIYGGFKISEIGEAFFKCDPETQRPISALVAYMGHPLKTAADSPFVPFFLQSPTFNAHSSQWVTARLENRYLRENLFNPGANSRNVVNLRNQTARRQPDGSILIKNIPRYRERTDFGWTFSGGMYRRIEGTADLRVYPDGSFEYTIRE